ncbi:MAG: VPLPA-CTERM sorting domain-containing protein [Nitrosopumilus sp.]|nr:VPLPA-CTERM sorting domain-containing protein [Nitrosopumilus sp.]
MKRIFLSTVVSVLFLLSSYSLQAATFMDLPDSTAACVSAGTCAANLISLVPGHGGGVLSETAMYIKNDFLSGETSVLVGYSLYNAYEIEYDVMSPFSGYLWLEGAMTYDLSSSQHDFTLYFDKLSPLASGVNFDNTLNIGLTSSDLLNGRGFYNYYVDMDSYWDSEATSGDLVIDSSNTICLALSGICDVSAIFNLLYLDYVQSGNIAMLAPLLISSDTRSSVLKIQHFQSSIEDPMFDYYLEQDFSVQPVPVPGAFWLFVSGLMGLGLLRKRR